MPCVFLSRPSSVLPCSSRHAYPAQAFPYLSNIFTHLKKNHLYSHIQPPLITISPTPEGVAPPLHFFLYIFAPPLHFCLYIFARLTLLSSRICTFVPTHLSRLTLLSHTFSRHFAPPRTFVPTHLPHLTPLSPHICLLYSFVPAHLPRLTLLSLHICPASLCCPYTLVPPYTFVPTHLPTSHLCPYTFARLIPLPHLTLCSLNICSVLHFCPYTFVPPYTFVLTHLPTLHFCPHTFAHFCPHTFTPSYTFVPTHLPCLTLLSTHICPALHFCPTQCHICPPVHFVPTVHTHVPRLTLMPLHICHALHFFPAHLPCLPLSSLQICPALLLTLLFLRICPALHSSRNWRYKVVEERKECKSICNFTHAVSEIDKLTHLQKYSPTYKKKWTNPPTFS